MRNKRSIVLFLIFAASALIFAAYLINSMSAQYCENGGKKQLFIESKSIKPFNIENSTKIAIKPTWLFTFKERALIEFGVYKYRSASKSADGIYIEIYADNNLLLSHEENPYQNAAGFIEDGVINKTKIEFDIPKGAKEIYIKLLPNKNADFDTIKLSKIRLLNANYIYVSIALLSLLAAVFSLVALTVICIKNSPKIISLLSGYFHSKERALFIYRFSFAAVLVCVVYMIMVSAGFSFNQEMQFLNSISDNDFFYITARQEAMDDFLCWLIPISTFYGFCRMGIVTAAFIS